MTQINTLIYNAITTLQDNANITNLTTLGTATMQGGLTVLSALGVTGTLTVSGKVTMSGYMFAAGTVSATGTKITGTVQVAWTVARTAGQAAGVYTITFPTAHPLGGNYIVNVSAQGLWGMLRNAVLPTSTSFQVVTYTVGTSTAADGIFSFMVLAS